MSPRAAARLEALSFEKVYDYAPGKSDWLASGLPTEGTHAGFPRAGDLAIRDAPTCSPSELLGDVRERVRAAGWSECMVVNGEGIVLGRVSRKVLGADSGATLDVQATAESVMDPGPGTIRPSTPLEVIVERLRERNLSRVLVTTSDGRLFGVLRREDAERRLEQEEVAAGPA